MKQKQIEEVLEIIKLRTEIDDKDALIESYIEEIGRRILHYCQRRDIPKALHWVWASMVIDALRVEQPEDFGVDDGVMSVKIGDTTVGPATSDEVTILNKSVIEELVLNYKADLHRYRKLSW